MDKQYEYKGYKYWVRVEPAVNEKTGESGFVAYVNNEQPGVFLYGTSVRDGQGRVMFFGSELAALTNATAVKQSEIDSKQISHYSS